MTKQLLYFILIIFSLTISAQQKKISFIGYVKDSVEIIKDAHVINLNTKIGTSSNEFGSFIIPVYKNDTLQITSLRHQTFFLVITEKLFQKKSATIVLKDKTYVLDEVSIKRHNLDGILGTDMKQTPEDIAVVKSKGALDFSKIDFNKPVIKPIDVMDRAKAPDMGKKTDPTRRFAGVGKGIGIPDGYSEKKRALRKKISFKEKFPYLLLSDFSPEFFFKELKIPKDKYYHFLEYCNPLGVEQLYKDKKIFEVIKILRRESKTYLEIIKK
ncbi:MAG: hypothetical protein ACPGUU_03315 [Flavobacteriaceae bacterium]